MQSVPTRIPLELVSYRHHLEDTRNSMKRFIGLVVFFMPLLTLGQEFKFELITSSDGLSQNNVLSIGQDDFGYMWFATYDGLNRFDGVEFKTYRSNGESNGLSSNLLVSLTIDKNNNVWVATFADGICKFNRSTETFVQFKNTPENPSLLTNNTINRLYCDSKGRIWANTTMSGTTCLLPQNDTTCRTIHFRAEDNNPKSLYENRSYETFEDSKGNIWILCQNSLNLMKMGPNGELRNDFCHIVNPDKHWDIHNMTETAEGLLFSHYFGLGLLKLNPEWPERSEIIDYKSEPMYFLCPDSLGNLWIGGHNGIQRFRYQPGREPLYIHDPYEVVGIPQKLMEGLFIRSMYRDREGILWFGTNGKGILQLNTKRTWFRHYTCTDNPCSIRNNCVTALHEDKNFSLWIGTEGGGISWLPDARSKDYKQGFKNFDVSDPGNQNFVMDIIDLKKNGKDALWLGSGYYSIMVQMDLVEDQWIAHTIYPEIRNQVMILCEDEYGCVWIGTYQGGLFKYVPNRADGQLLSYTTRNSQLVSDIIRNIYEDSRSRLWIATDKGLLLLSREQKRLDNLEFTHFEFDPTDSTCINNSYCVPILETSQRKIWIGTFGGGVNIYQEATTSTNGTFTRMPLNGKLPNSMIKAMVEDNRGNIWITTNKGLSRIDAACTKIRNYSTYDGLQDMQFKDLSAIKRHDGEILLGGVNGFNAFYPEEIGEDSTPPRIVLNELEVMNRKVKVLEKVDGRIILKKPLIMTDTIHLDHKHNNLRISFSAIHYLVPKGNLYKYTLENFETQWNTVDAEHAVARYTNMEPGKYIFKVLASNSDGYWTPKPKELCIIIEPPYWLRAWFIIAALVLVSLLFYGIVYFRVYLVKQRNYYLEKMVEQRNRETIGMNYQLREQAEFLQESARQLSIQNNELDRHRNRLEILVEERTHELSIARDKAEESDRLKSKFLASVSHEIRTPMNAIMGFSALMKDPNIKPEKRKRYFELIEQGGKNLMDIIDAMIQFSMLDAETHKLSKGRFYLNHLLGVVYDECLIGHNANGEVQLFLNNALAEANICLNTDYSLIKSILGQLVQNALKYTQKGSVELGTHSDLNRLFIFVKDTGIGIPKENQEAIFKSFVKIASEETGYKQGIGLGLSISKNIAELLGGTLEVESEYGVGSTFTFSMPMDEE